MQPNSRAGVTFQVRLVSADESREELLRTLRSVVGPVRGTAGCLRCNLLEDVQDPTEVVFVEDWRSEEAFVRHIRTDVFRRVLQGMDLAAEPPEVRIKSVSGVGGMERLRELVEAGREHFDGKETT